MIVCRCWSVWRAHREAEWPMNAVTEFLCVPWCADWDTPVLTYAVSNNYRKYRIKRRVWVNLAPMSPVLFMMNWRVLELFCTTAPKVTELTSRAISRPWQDPVTTNSVWNTPAHSKRTCTQQNIQRRHHFQPQTCTTTTALLRCVPKSELTGLAGFLSLKALKRLKQTCNNEPNSTEGHLQLGKWRNSNFELHMYYLFRKLTDPCFRRQHDLHFCHSSFSLQCNWLFAG